MSRRHECLNLELLNVLKILRTSGVTGTMYSRMIQKPPYSNPGVGYVDGLK